MWARIEESGSVRYHDGRLAITASSEGQVINSISSDANGNPVISTSDTTAYMLFRRRVLQINRKHAAEHAFSRRLIDSQEQESKRFAAEIHDGLGQSLVIVKNRARLSLRQTDEKEAMLDHLGNISDTASDAIEEAREIAFNLRPHLIDRLGSTKTSVSMLGKVFGASNILFEAQIDRIDEVLENDSEILLYRRNGNQMTF